MAVMRTVLALAIAVATAHAALHRNARPAALHAVSADFTPGAVVVMEEYTNGMCSGAPNATYRMPLEQCISDASSGRSWFYRKVKSAKKCGVWTMYSSTSCTPSDAKFGLVSQCDLCFPGQTDHNAWGMFTGCEYAQSQVMLVNCTNDICSNCMQVKAAATGSCIVNPMDSRAYTLNEVVDCGFEVAQFGFNNVDCMGASATSYPATPANMCVGGWKWRTW